MAFPCLTRLAQFGLDLMGDEGMKNGQTHRHMYRKTKIRIRWALGFDGDPPAAQKLSTFIIKY